MECNIDFIKWMCEKAEWVIKEDGAIVSPAGHYYYHNHRISNIDKGFNGTLSVQEMWMLDYYPLLLQRAIEGVNRLENKRGTKYLPIMIDSLGVHIHSQWHDIRRDWGSSPNIDNSKEYCLKYIYEQETK